jgi:hypothetical protein
MAFKKKKSSAKVTITENYPKLKDGCIHRNNSCRGRDKVCPTCSMVFCDKHFNREIHLEYCAARVKQDRELLNNDGYA